MFSITTQVRYKETDQGGRVYHSNYLVWLDIARTEFLKANDIDYAQMEKNETFLVVRKASLEYLAPAYYDQIVKIIITSTKTDKIKVDINYEILDNKMNKLLVKAYIQLITVNKNGKPIKIPENIKTVFNQQNTLL